MDCFSLFPYNSVRPIQDKMVRNICMALEHRRHLVVHAPTGLGKSAASLAPAIRKALDENFTIFFLTSRHMQHLIAVNTLRDIKEKHKLDFACADIIGKQHMCAIPNVGRVSGQEFSEFCKKMREDKKCEYYSNVRKGSSLSIDAKYLLGQLILASPLHCEEMVKRCIAKKMCPYEMACAMSEKSHVVVADYNYIFNPAIREAFFNRNNKELDHTIVIVDEAHNLPERLRELLTKKLSTWVLKMAIQEAKKYGYEDIEKVLHYINNLLGEYSGSLSVGGEVLIPRVRLMNDIDREYPYDDLIADLSFMADAVRETEKRSFLGVVEGFLESWKKGDKGFARILSVQQGGKENNVTLSYRCLDPSMMSKPIVDGSYITLIMSGTLTPTTMYRDMMGFSQDTQCIEFNSPFPRRNRLNLVVPKTTTKFTARSEDQFRDIAKVCADIINAVPGNSAVFFPSYQIRDNVYQYFSEMSTKTVFNEYPNLSKNDKNLILEKFRASRKVGAVLLATTMGSFGEGVDLPGDLLKCVVVVGLPLSKPDLETKELIAYYDKKVGRGWDYGYVYPAFNKVLQSAGRCIRSERDKGVIVFLDERYAWKRYAELFPRDWEMVVTLNYQQEIREFFSNHAS